jgi:hypothetical protein
MRRNKRRKKEEHLRKPIQHGEKKHCEGKEGNPRKLSRLRLEMADSRNSCWAKKENCFEDKSRCSVD